MNDSYIISKEEALQRLDDTGPIEVGLDLPGIDASLPLTLDDSDRIKRVDHRCHKRFQIKEDAFALVRSISAGQLQIHGKSMGCIAYAVFKAMPARLGRIDNISMGGLMFQHVAGKTQIDRTFVLDILLADYRFYLANIPFKIKADVGLPDDIPGSTFEMRQVRLQFQNLSAMQQTKLKNFITKHGVAFGEFSDKV